MEIRLNPELDIATVARLFAAAGLRRPVDDEVRLRQMFDKANYVLAAFEGDLLIGVARALTDFAYVCYLSDLAVAPEHQKAGVGAALLERLSKELGPQVSIVLLSAPEAMGFYPKVGYELSSRCYVKNRTR